MDKTPRTDTLKIPSEALLLLGNKGVPERITKAILMLGDHARQLETELSAAYKKYNDALIHASNAERFLNEKIENLETGNGIFVDMVHELDKILNKYKRDAERYRWLREKARTDTGEPWIARSSLGSISAWTGEYADAAIDAAMDQTEQKGVSK